MNLDGAVETQAKEFITYLLVALGVLFAAGKAFFTCRGWYRELKDARGAKKKAEIDRINETAHAEISGERDLSNRLERVGDAQEEEIRLLWFQLQRAQHTIKGYQITVERQTKALAECWQSQAQNRQNIDVLLEIEMTRQRQDQLEAKMQEEGK